MTEQWLLLDGMNNGDGATELKVTPGPCRKDCVTVGHLPWK